MNYCQYTSYKLLIPTSYTACCALILTPPALGGDTWISLTVNIKPEAPHPPAARYVITWKQTHT